MVKEPVNKKKIDEEDPWSSSLSAVALAIRSTYYHIALPATSAQLVFKRNMVLPIEMKIDWKCEHQ
jgi:hypothetical protein